MGRGGNPTRAPLAAPERWSAVSLFGYDPRFASRFVSTPGGSGDDGTVGNAVAEVTWAIGDAGPIVRIIGGLAGREWQLFTQIGSICACGQSNCEHQALLRLSVDRGLEDNAALASMPYDIDRDLSIPGHQIRFRARSGVHPECGPREVIVMGGRRGWSVTVRFAAGTSSVVTSPAQCTCQQRTCFHRLFVAWILRGHLDRIGALQPRPRAALSAA
jgi:hypothetical protein